MKYVIMYHRLQCTRICIHTCRNVFNPTSRRLSQEDCDLLFINIIAINFKKKNMIDVISCFCLVKRILFTDKSFVISNFAKVTISYTNIQHITHDRRKRFYLKRVEIWVHIDLGLQTVMWINLVFACHFMKGWVISGYIETEYNRDDAYVYLWKGRNILTHDI